MRAATAFLAGSVVLGTAGLSFGEGPVLGVASTAGRVEVRATNPPSGIVVLQRSRDPALGPWRSVDAAGSHGDGSVMELEGGSEDDRSFYRTLSHVPLPSLTRYVDPVKGADANDGLSEAAPFRTLEQAFRAVPLVLAGFYEIRLASGEYEGAVELIRSGSPGDLTAQDVLTYPIESLPAVRVSGPAEGGAVIRAVPGGGPTLRFMNLTVSLRSLRVEAAGENAITIAGGSLVLENVHVGCTNASNAGVYCHRSNLYLGGTNSIRGPFATGISLRTYSLARPGTKDLPNGMVLEIDGSTRALFLRDFSTFTSTFNSGVIRIWNADAAVYAILGSNVFLTGGAGEVFLDLQDVKTAFNLTHRSEANVHNMRLNRLTGGGDFFLGRLMSILSIERGTSPSNLVITNLDHSSWVQVPAAWNAVVPAR